jgi:CPA2 family monovalent cation:H+ antiporter-2
VLVELLARQRSADPDLHGFDDVLPGFGEVSAVRIAEGTSACGQTLAKLNLRARTGATVLAIRRGEEGILTPSGHDKLLPGDVLALSGTDQAVEAARELLAARDDSRK